ncbi:MAG: monooxygenase [Candidatus Liberibacter europaeus]|uniref:Monooxygenase n=1 Tax=Candidatus Liberibacter europaeus TaxID=744859 RepID=A0A2T4VX56_9HYPH|nr:monooxygenase [Candidatus Liberibacter europaeus]PTL86365.1 MAG: monooxygenase [Candidatus Liberibacter europaeus]
MTCKKQITELPSVAIVGAGISGLTLALSLCKQGIRSYIFERKDYLSEKGFGLQISPNASRILKKINVLDQLEKIWFEPKEFIFRSGSTLKELSRIPCKDYAHNNWNGAYGVLKRATLQKILESKLKSQSLAKLHLSTHITDHSLKEISHIINQTPDLLVGADGVHSNIRQQIDNQPIMFSGSILRFVIPKNEAPEFIDSQSISMFFGSNSHMVTYPLQEDNTINIAAISSNPYPSEVSPLKSEQDNFYDENKELFLNNFANWNKEIKQLITNIPKESFYPLFECKCSRWHNYQDTVLIGDAAHTFLPSSAQGANMAIEDAYILSKLLTNNTVSKAISIYQEIRVKRINKIYSRTNFNNTFYHLRGPFSLCRDIALKFGPRKPLSKSLDWIYKYQVPENI